MPRRPRVVVEGGIYHVYNRFARGAEIFLEGDEAPRFLELIRTVRDRDDLTLLAWCLPPNHYHLAVRIGPVPLARSMGYVQARFGQSYNRRWKSSGPRWQSRYKARLVEEPAYLTQLSAYIHLNPVTAGVVEDPAEYVYTGHRELLGKIKHPLIDTEAVLAEYGDTLRSARRAYVRSLRGERESEWIGERPGALPWSGRQVDRPLEPAPPRAWIDAGGVSAGLQRPPENGCQGRHSCNFQRIGRIGAGHDEVTKLASGVGTPGQAKVGTHCSGRVSTADRRRSRMAAPEPLADRRHSVYN